MNMLRKVDLSRIRIPDVRVSSILNEEQQAFLKTTISEIGVVQDIVVRDLGDGTYELVAGKSRLNELIAQGYTEHPVKVIQADEKLGLIMNIIENVARGNFDYISISKSIRRLKTMGATDDELERIFPWKRQWINFIEQLQDLPEDVCAALATRKITPSHVSVALHMPTPIEVHDALRTAINLEWDTGTLKTFVENRLEQISRAKAEAESKGLEPVIPPAVPEKLIQYKQCLLCGYKKPSETVTVQMICDACQDLIHYITSQLGPPEDAIQTIYAALQAYFGIPQPRQRESTETKEEPSPK